MGHNDHNDHNEQMEQANRLLLDMVKNQKINTASVLKTFIVTVICYTLLLISMVVGFFVYESQFNYETAATTTTETITQEVSGTDSEINNVEGNMYKDNSTHNE